MGTSEGESECLASETAEERDAPICMRIAITLVDRVCTFITAGEHLAFLASGSNPTVLAHGRPGKNAINA